MKGKRVTVTLFFPNDLPMKQSEGVNLSIALKRVANQLGSMAILRPKQVVEVTGWDDGVVGTFSVVEDCNATIN